jgi:hypothetical protein
LDQEKVLGPRTQCCAGETPDGPLPMSLTWWWHRLVRLGLPLWFEGEGKINKQGVCHTVALPFTEKKSILRQKKNYGNSNISPCKNIVFQKNPLKETKILQAIITLL